MAKGHKIITHFYETPRTWAAVLDNYDGAPDAHHPVGYGPTETAAVADLLQQEDELVGGRER